MKRWLASIALSIVACGGSPPPVEAPTAAVSTSGWRASSTAERSLLTITVPAGTSVRDALPKLAAGGTCFDPMLVWGDLKAPDDSRPIEIHFDGGVLAGFLICEHDSEAFLRLQVGNPKLKAGHGGSADLTWRDGQLFLKRRWGAGEAMLERLDPPPDNVFQKGEVLAALFYCKDPNSLAKDVFTALARVPKVFLFGMYPLHN